jgi:adenosylcobinamide-GDP ribazoletransferase
MSAWFSSLRCAFAFLTRLPVGDANFDGCDVGRSTAWFPFVGLVVAVLELLVLTLAQRWLGDVAATVLAGAAMALLTCAFHLDALADMADGFGGGHDRASVLRIMRDHVIGAYGAVALMLALGLRISFIVGLAELDRVGPWLICAAAVGRWASAWTGWRRPYARREGAGLGSAVTDHVGPVQVAIASSIAALICWVCVGWWAALIAGLALLICARLGRMCMRKIGGVTGDTLGATTMLVELGVLGLGLALELAR